MRPSFITTKRSAIAMASSWSCVTMMVESAPSRCSTRMSRPTSARSAASRLDSGSSTAASTRGRMASARARATRCCCPPESCRGRRSARWLEPGQAQHLGDPLGLGGPLGATHFKPEGDVARHRQVREQRVALEHQPHVPLVRGQAQDAAAIDLDVAAGRVDEGRPPCAAWWSCRSRRGRAAPASPPRRTCRLTSCTAAAPL